MDVEPDRGLTESEVRRRFDQHGPNKLREAKRLNIWEIVLEQFKSMVIIVLVIAGTVAFMFQHWAEGIAIVAVLFVGMNAYGRVDRIVTLGDCENLWKCLKVD